MQASWASLAQRQRINAVMVAAAAAEALLQTQKEREGTDREVDQVSAADPTSL